MSDLDSTRLRAVLSYDPDSGLFMWRTTGKCAGNLHATGYVRIRIDGVSHRAHRLAWLYVHGAWPVGQLDHINRIRNDNRIANLREASAALNASNRGPRTDSTSGFPGVSWYARHGKWQACSGRGGRTRHLGYYDTPTEAHAAYIAAQ